MKLNLGCGRDIRPGYVNVDKYHEKADVRADLEKFPWPWEDNSVEFVSLRHVLEHLGRDPEVFIGIMKELYRVCKAGAKIQIEVPHPRHDNFMDDPTHVRPVTLGVLSLFSREYNEQWDKNGDANSLLAMYHGVDFKITRYEMIPDRRVRDVFKGREDLEQAVAQLNNIVQELRFELEVQK